MNIVLWILRALLALWNIVGANFILKNYDTVANTWALNVLPRPVWMVLAGFQILLAVVLVLPGERLHKLTARAAAGLSALSLLGIALYAQYAGFPGLLWGVIPAIVAAFIAYQRRHEAAPQLTAQGSP